MALVNGKHIIVSPGAAEYGMQCHASSSEMLRMLGLRPGGHLPAEGMPPRLVDGIKVWVNASPPARYHHGWSAKPSKVKSSAHRVMAECPACGAHLSAGRLHQHKCKT
jgi:hypothetical protein